MVKGKVPSDESAKTMMDNKASDELHLKAPGGATTSDTGNTKMAHPTAPLFTIVTSYLSVLLLYMFGSARDMYRKVFPKGSSNTRPGYAPLMSEFSDFFNRRIYRRISDCWNRPIDSRPSRVIGVIERVSHDGNVTFQATGRIIPAINMSSYNYLGFAEDTPFITHRVLDSIEDHGIASCSAPQEVGQSAPVAALERRFAEFVGKDDAIVCGMGFGTNLGGLPSLFGTEALVISDTLNHSSLVNGIRASGAKVKAFPHGDYSALERILREAVVLGSQPNGEYVPWKRIVVVLEGVYSMEGEIVDLQRVVALKKKYKFLLFVDEAHSIGAIGSTGRGVCEHCGVDPKDVDVLMGTFTKSFGSIGGYIAGDQALIDYLRKHSPLSLFCDTLAPPCAEQVLATLDVIQGKDDTLLGRKRIHQLKENSRFLRQGLQDLGLLVLGDDTSPVIPVMVYNLGKLPLLSRRCLERGLAIVVVGYPATPLLEARVRFCVSAAHTRADLQYTLDVMEELCGEVCLTYNKRRAIKS